MNRNILFMSVILLASISMAGGFDSPIEEYTFNKWSTAYCSFYSAYCSEGDSIGYLLYSEFEVDETSDLCEGMDYFLEYMQVGCWDECEGDEECVVACVNEASYNYNYLKRQIDMLFFQTMFYECLWDGPGCYEDFLGYYDEKQNNVRMCYAEGPV